MVDAASQPTVVEYFGRVQSMQFSADRSRVLPSSTVDAASQPTVVEYFGRVQS
eukprot:COSAG02_NODE_5959_length_3910_cov_1.862766_4_plen_52_part_01